MKTDEDLSLRQAAGGRVEARMKEFLLEFSPAQELKVCDMLAIARFARQLSFDEFSALHRS